MTSAQTSSTQKKVASTIQANQSFKKPGVVSIMDVMRTNESEVIVIHLLVFNYEVGFVCY